MSPFFETLFNSTVAWLAELVGDNAKTIALRVYKFTIIHAITVTALLGFIFAAHAVGNESFIWWMYAIGMTYSVVSAVALHVLLEPIRAAAKLTPKVFRRAYYPFADPIWKLKHFHAALLMTLLTTAGISAINVELQWTILNNWFGVTCLALVGLNTLAVRLADRAMFNLVNYTTVFTFNICVALTAFFVHSFPNYAQQLRFAGAPDNAEYRIVTADTTGHQRVINNNETEFIETSIPLPKGRMCKVDKSEKTNTESGVAMVFLYCPPADADRLLTKRVKGVTFWVPLGYTMPSTSPTQTHVINNSQTVTTATPIPVNTKVFTANPQNYFDLVTLQPNEVATIQWVGGNIKPNTPGYTADYQPNPIDGYGVVSDFTGARALWSSLPYKEYSLHATLLALFDGYTRTTQKFEVGTGRAVVANNSSRMLTVSLYYNDLDEHAKLHTGAQNFRVEVKKP